MTSDISLRVENLGKKYRIGTEQPRAATMAGRLLQTALSPFDWLISQARGATEAETLWAVRHVSFELKRGEVLGIIGSNGAGKSTLLKLLSRITEPSEGHAEVHGRLAALLEVGTGMHPELTGRENIFLNGCILGMRKREIQQKFDEIIAFSGIEKFIDTPVKRYSSGMRVRLGFAIAAHLEPEILVVDEVLAVGDADFQKKCLGKMQDVAGQGRTVLFVSHNMQAMRSLCSRAILLEHGGSVYDGSPVEATERYLNQYSQVTKITDLNTSIKSLPPDESILFNDIQVSQNGKIITEYISSSEPVDIKINYHVLKKTTGLRIFVDLLDSEHNLLFRSFHDEDADAIPSMEPGDYTSQVSIPANILGPFHYEFRFHATVHCIRMCFSGISIRLPIKVALTGNYNRAYSKDRTRGKLAIHLPWNTRYNENNCNCMVMKNANH